MTSTAAKGQSARSRRGASNRGVALATLMPLTVIVVLFFLVPIVGMTITSLQDGGTGGFTLDNYQAMSRGNGAQALRNSTIVSFVSSFVALLAGLLIAWCISFINSSKLNAITGVISSVLSNSGGAPLAFSFIVLAGNTGFITAALLSVDSSFTLYSVKGLILMYQYFLIPTVVLLILPSFQAMKTSWKEANTSLGGSGWTFWTKVGLPIMFPTILGVWILEFGAAFATHASAAVLIGTGTFPLIVLQIAAEMGSSASSGGEHVAMAMGLTTTVIAIVTLIAFNWLQERSRRWLS